jgi:hypothetical protein
VRNCGTTTASTTTSALEGRPEENHGKDAMLIIAMRAILQYRFEQYHESHNCLNMVGDYTPCAVEQLEPDMVVCARVLTILLMGCPRPSWIVPRLQYLECDGIFVAIYGFREDGVVAVTIL